MTLCPVTNSNPPALDRLASWGLLDRLVATGLPPTRQLRFDTGSVVLQGRVEGSGAADELYSPPRTVLDSLLVDAAREAGAEVVEGFDAEAVLGDGHTVTGIQGRERSASGGRTSRNLHGPARGGRRRQELVAGADSRRPRPFGPTPGPRRRPTRTGRASSSTVARCTAAPLRVIGAWPTKDGLTVTYLGMPAPDFDRFRADPDAALLEVRRGRRPRGTCPEATRVAPLRGTTDLPNRVLVSTGAGWVLAGDAGLVMDPGTRQGMGHALQDAEALAAAICEYLGGGDRTRLARYQSERDRRRLPMYKFTLDLATYMPRPGTDRLFEAIAASPDQTQAFFACSPEHAHPTPSSRSATSAASSAGGASSP